MRVSYYGGPGGGPGGRGPGMGGGPGGRGPGMGGPGMGGHRPPPPPPPPGRRYRGGCLGCMLPVLAGMGGIIAVVALLVSMLL